MTKIAFMSDIHQNETYEEIKGGLKRASAKEMKEKVDYFG